MPESDALPTLAKPFGPCPRCGRSANFSPTLTGLAIVKTGTERVVVLECMGCSEATVVIERFTPGSDWAGVHWWPTPGAGSLDESVPAALASAYDEGMRAVAIAAPRAAAVMFRAALAEIVKDKSTATAQAKGSLYEQLKEMGAEGTLHPSLAEWADEVRQRGNLGAHPNAADAVSVEEAADLGHLVAQMINVLYETPARIARTRASRQP